ncbi:hypothetical protein [Rhizobium alarense]|uniref:hypothetical protein n=1 Tax=Rhizobium alarense TaxID=2846851 RepID=UPI002E2EFFDE|nr:hypothetical protein [Rhizobium alarense]
MPVAIPVIPGLAREAALDSRDVVAGDEPNRIGGDGGQDRVREHTTGNCLFQRFRGLTLRLQLGTKGQYQPVTAIGFHGRASGGWIGDGRDVHGAQMHGHSLGSANTQFPRT